MFPNHSQKKPGGGGIDPSSAGKKPPFAKGKGKKKSKGKKPSPFKKGSILAGPMGKALLGK